MAVTDANDVELVEESHGQDRHNRGTQGGDKPARLRSCTAKIHSDERREGQNGSQQDDRPRRWQWAQVLIGLLLAMKPYLVPLDASQRVKEAKRYRHHQHEEPGKLKDGNQKPQRKCESKDDAGCQRSRIIMR